MPNDEIEGMIAAQLIAAHNASIQPRQLQIAVKSRLCAKDEYSREALSLSGAAGCYTAKHGTGLDINAHDAAISASLLLQHRCRPACNACERV